MRDSKLILKYTLLHLAELALLVAALSVAREWLSLPTWITVAVPVLWVLKDGVLFPKVWRAYACEDSSPMKLLVGLEAIVLDSLDPAGYVRVRGELWKARVRTSRDAAKRGDRTRVVDIEGMTLIVELFPHA